MQSERKSVNFTPLSMHTWNGRDEEEGELAESGDVLIEIEFIRVQVQKLFRFCGPK